MRWLLSLIFLSFSIGSSAQFYNGLQMSFGKNRIQYDDERTWVYFRFKKFDTYFYANGKALATYSSAYAAQEIKRMSRFLDYKLEDKINYMIFNDLSDLKETNIGLLTEDQYNIGGQTHIIDNKVFIYFSGSHRDFEEQISRGTATIFLNQIMYGGSFSNTVKNSMLLNFPYWFSEGFISYMTEDWSTEVDTKVRDGFLSGRFKDFKRLSPEEQVLAGHSLWKYIHDKYGRRALTDVLFLSKINRSIESGFIYVLGVDYNGLMEDWQKWYKEIYTAESQLGFSQPNNPYFKRVSRKRKYSQAQISHDGQYMAYVQNQIGKVKLRIVDLNSSKSKTIEKFGYKLDEKVDYSYPVLAWSPNSNYLTYVMENQDDLILTFYDLDRKKKKSKFINNFDKILSLSYNTRGNLLVMSAVMKGQSDIFVYNIGSNTVKRITNDIFDDEDPVFVNGGNGIIFASNRLDDTLRIDRETGKNVIRDTIRGRKNKDIFYYDLSTKSKLLKRVTETPLADERQPQYLAYNRFSWISNFNGVYNRQVGKFDSVIAYIDTIVHYKHIAKSFPVSMYSNNIKWHHMNFAAEKYVEIIPSDGRDIFYVRPLPEFQDFERLEPVYTTYMQGLLQKERQLQYVKTIREKNKKAEKKIDTPKPNPQNNNRKKFKVLYVGENNDSTSLINKKQYQAVSEPIKSKEATQSTETKNKQSSEQLYRTQNYEPQYTISELVSQMDFSYMNVSYQPFQNIGLPIYQNQGFAAFMKFGVMDLMEDYRIVAGVRLSPNLQGNEYLLSYSDLKKRLDKEYTFHRMILNTTTLGQFQVNILYNYVHEGFAKFSWPFDQVRSLRTTLSFRNDYEVIKSVEHNTLIEPSRSTNRAGIKLEYVFDNTRNPALNIHHGTRYKLFAEYFQPISQLENNTFILGLDYRKYIPIVGNFIWANRVAASTSFGTQRLIYYLGAVDNWMFPNFNQNIQIDQTQEFVYQALATNMRGFDQNIRNGNSFVVINSELRLPPFALLGRRPVKSDFLANFQILGFFDVGTAWSGPNPFSDDNSLFRQEFYQKPITVIVINQNDPIVAGYGFGLRSRLFGYFIRADWAWGLQNGYKQDRKFYLSLSLDF
jgi:hypothetical protein